LERIPVLIGEVVDVVARRHELADIEAAAEQRDQAADQIGAGIDAVDVAIAVVAVIIVGIVVIERRVGGRDRVAAECVALDALADGISLLRLARGEAAIVLLGEARGAALGEGVALVALLVAGAVIDALLLGLAAILEALLPGRGELLRLRLAPAMAAGLGAEGLALLVLRLGRSGETAAAMALIGVRIAAAAVLIASAMAAATAAALGSMGVAAAMTAAAARLGEGGGCDRHGGGSGEEDELTHDFDSCVSQQP